MPTLRTPDGRAPRNLLESTQALAVWRQAQEAATPTAQPNGIQPAVVRPGQSLPGGFMPTGEGGIVKAQMPAEPATKAPANATSPSRIPSLAPEELELRPISRNERPNRLRVLSSRNEKQVMEMLRDGRLQPDYSIHRNSRYYEMMDEDLQATEGDIRSKWFGAAAQVTGMTVIGAADATMPNLYFMSDDDEAMLRPLSQSLARMNFETYRMLRAGKEIPGLEGLRGKELDYALVEREQKAVSALLNVYFQDKPPELRTQVMESISKATNLQKALGGIWATMEEYLPGRSVTEVVRERFPNGDYDFSNEKHRVILGKAMVDLRYQEGM